MLPLWIESLSKLGRRHFWLVAAKPRTIFQAQQITIAFQYDRRATIPVAISIERSPALARQQKG